VTSTGPHSDQYWYTPSTCTGSRSEKNSPDRSLDLSGEFLVVMIVGLDFTRAP